jgi:hypothetical protein
MNLNHKDLDKAAVLCGYDDYRSYLQANGKINFKLINKLHQVLEVKWLRRTKLVIIITAVLSTIINYIILKS